MPKLRRTHRYYSEDVDQDFIFPNKICILNGISPQTSIITDMIAGNYKAKLVKVYFNEDKKMQDAFYFFYNVDYYKTFERAFSGGRWIYCGKIPLKNKEKIQIIDFLTGNTIFNYSAINENPICSIRVKKPTQRTILIIQVGHTTKNENGKKWVFANHRHQVQKDILNV